MDLSSLTRVFTMCSKTSSSERAMVIGLGGLNLFGVIILGTMLKYGSPYDASDFLSFASIFSNI